MGRKLTTHPLSKVINLSFIFFAVMPIVYTLGIALFDDSLLYNLQLIEKETFTLLAKSCAIAFTVSTLSTLFGTILGFLLYKTNILFRSFFKLVLLIPLFISPYILAVAWKDFFFLFFNTTSFISSNTGVIIVLTIIFTPLAMLIIGSALSNISSQLEENAIMTTNIRNVIIKITLPLIKPALISSFVLIFIFSISEFSVPAFFGVKVFTTEIFTQFSAFYNHTLAIFQSLLLIFICISLLYLDRKHIGNSPFLSVSDKGMKTKNYSLKNVKAWSMLFLFSWFLISVLLPFIILFIQSFKNDASKFIQAFELLKPTFINSIALAFFGAILIVFIGFSAAYQSAVRSRKSFDWILLVIFAIPSTIYGISLIKFYNQPELNFIYSSYAIILIAYVGKFSFISSKLIANAIKQIPNSLDEAAQVEGITFFSRIQKILIPIIMPSLFTAFIISFIFSLGELGTTIMIYPPGTEIMPIKVFTIMANAPQSLTSSMTLIVFSITLLLITSLYFIVKFFTKKFSFVNG
ncbi:MAG: iron ABC transporter permease [Flavobacteriales bacterium]|nr:iron ABC transporter permease [Flavobacteriales bacterium]